MVGMDAGHASSFSFRLSEGCGKWVVKQQRMIDKQHAPLSLTLSRRNKPLDKKKKSRGLDPESTVKYDGSWKERKRAGSVCTEVSFE